MSTEADTPVVAAANPGPGNFDFGFTIPFASPLKDSTLWLPLSPVEPPHDSNPDPLLRSSMANRVNLLLAECDENLKIISARRQRLLGYKYQWRIDAAVRAFQDSRKTWLEQAPQQRHGIVGGVTRDTLIDALKVLPDATMAIITPALHRELLKVATDADTCALYPDAKQPTLFLCLNLVFIQCRDMPPDTMRLIEIDPENPSAASAIAEVFFE